MRLPFIEPFVELLSSSGFDGGVGIFIAASVAAIACSIADLPLDSGNVVGGAFEFVLETEFLQFKIKIQQIN